MNIQEMMKQAKIMQKRMEEMQAKLGQMEVQGQSGAGLVNVVMTCRGDVRKITISPELINPAEKEMLEDLLVAALNMAKTNADATLSGETRKMMQELGLPTDGAGLPGF
jgi:nucleoid-associated protein EbfC